MLLLFGNFYFSPIGVQSIVMAAYLYVLSVYLSASISQKLLVQSLRNILSAVVIYGLGLDLLWRGVVIHYVFQVLWMAPCLHTMSRQRQCEKGVWAK